MQIFINGNFYKENNANISVFDHGLLYGDGIFETIRAYNGIAYKLDEHLNRLFQSAESISLRVPLKKLELKEAVHSAIKKNKLNDAYIRLTVTRGRGGIGYASACAPTVIVIAKKFMPYPTEIYERGVSAITYNAERFLPKAKSINCMPLVLAKIAAEKGGCFEAILVDNKGNMTEGTSSNIFFVRKNALYTPKENMLHGITRGAVLGIAKQSMEIKETKIRISDIHLFKECFLTNTSAEIVPVVKINNGQISKAPGAITRMLISKLKKEIEKETKCLKR